MQLKKKKAKLEIWYGFEHKRVNTLMKMPHKMLRPGTAGIARVFSPYSSAKRKLHCKSVWGECQSRNDGGSRGLSVSHFGPSGDAILLEPAVSLNFLLYVSHGTCAQSMKASEIWQLFGKRCSSICGVLLIFEPFFCPLWLGPMPIGVHGKLQLNWMSFADPVL